MADKANPPNPLKPKENDLSMELRLVGVFLAIGAILFAWQYFFKPATPPPNETPSTTAQDKKEPAQSTPAASPAAAQNPAAPGATPAAPTGASTVAASVEEIVRVETDLALITFSNRGASVKSWLLKKYCVRCCEDRGNLLDVVNKAGSGTTPSPMSFEFRNQKPGVDLNQALFVARKSADGKKVDFEYSHNGVTARKSFEFKNGSYQTAISSEVIQNGAQIPHLISWRGGFGDSTVRDYWGQQKAIYWDPAKSKLVTKAVGDVKDGPVSNRAQMPFAGIADQYFAAVALPPQGASMELIAERDSFKPEGSSDVQPHIGVSLGGDGVNKFNLFVGPKDLDTLKAVNPLMEHVVDWSEWFGFLARPLFWILHWTYHHVIHNWGWAIVLVTIAINIALLPLKITSLKSAKKMQALQPEVNRINEKFKNVSVKDPRKADQQSELMDLYKKHGVNPLGGCIPLALQIPFFFAFYNALTVVSDLRGAPWLWVCDLSRPESIAIRMLPILLLVTQFLMQKMTPPSPGMDPAQQKMMMIMPLGLTFMFWYQPAGLVLYWLTGNLVGIVQQWLTNRLMPSPPVPATPAVAPDSAKKKKK